MPILSVEGKKFRVGDLATDGTSWTVLVDDMKVSIEMLEQSVGSMLVRTGGRVVRITANRRDERDAYAIELNGRPLVARLEEEIRELHASGLEAAAGPALVTSPMAGKIASVKTSAGATVEEGQALVVLEAMKMENEIAAPKRGTVKEIYVQAGNLAKPGDKLLLIE